MKSEPFRTPKGDKEKDILFTSLSPSLHAYWAFFFKKACQINLLSQKVFSAPLQPPVAWYEKYEKPKVFSSTEKMLSSSLVSSNYWHAKVPCSSCLVLARLCSVGKDLSST